MTPAQITAVNDAFDLLKGATNGKSTELLKLTTAMAVAAIRCCAVEGRETELAITFGLKLFQCFGVQDEAESKGSVQ